MPISFGIWWFLRVRTIECVWGPMRSRETGIRLINSTYVEFPYIWQFFKSKALWYDVWQSSPMRLRETNRCQFAFDIWRIIWMSKWENKKLSFCANRKMSICRAYDTFVQWEQVKLTFMLNSFDICRFRTYGILGAPYDLCDVECRPSKASRVRCITINCSWPLNYANNSSTSKAPIEDR